jgi:hypothetical protein
MTLAVRARIEAAPNFLSNLEIAHQFFVEQDADSASERFRKLKAELREMVAVLGLVSGQWTSGTFLHRTFSSSAAKGANRSTACRASGLAKFARIHRKPPHRFVCPLRNRGGVAGVETPTATYVLGRGLMVGLHIAQ